MGWRDLLAPARAAPPRWTPSAAQETEATRAGEFGAPTPDWTPAAPDLSGVRVHADAEAAALSDDYGARAFTYGSDIFLGSEGRGDPGLLAHEMMHAAQQEAEPGPALQFDPKGAKAGPGVTPPDEDFIADENNWGAEDQHLLFANDQAVSDAEDVLAAFAKQQTAAVYVHVHGYASEVGPGDYNLNLSAQRGAAVRKRLLELLPEGSKVAIFAHGKTAHFGAAEQNRRVGLSLIGPVESGFRLGGPSLVPHFTLGGPPAGGWLKPPTFPVTGTVPGVPPIGSITDEPPGPRVTPPPSGLGQLPPSPYIPRHLMDNPALLSPSGLRGHLPSETGNVVDQFDQAYLKYRFTWGIKDESIAAWLANKEVSSNIEAYWLRNDPSGIDQSNDSTNSHILNSPNLFDAPKWFGKKDKKK